MLLLLLLKLFYLFKRDVSISSFLFNDVIEEGFYFHPWVPSKTVEHVR